MPAADGILPLLQLNRSARPPLHAQLCDQIRAAIARGDLQPGQRVPSSRELAAALQLSRMPVITAYAQLTAEGYFTARAGAGTRIAPSLLAPAPPPPKPGPGSLRRPLAARSRRLPRFAREPWHGWGAFGVHQPALDQFPYAQWARLLHRHARDPQNSALGRMDPLGYVRLREALCSYLRSARMVRCEPAQILITSGSQQAVDLCARVLCDEATPVWIEEPGYWLAREAFLATGVRLIPVPVDAEGLQVAAGRKLCPRARLALVTPAHQYPLGAVMSAARRFQLLQWAEQAGAWILEDDYDGEFRFTTRPLQSLHAMDRHQRVVYIGTFSKVIFPSLRVGYVVLPPDLVDAFVSMRRAADICPAHVPQAALADFIAEGHFARCIQRARRLYGERQAALVEQLRARLSHAWTLLGEGAGMHLTVATARRCSDVAIATAAAEQGLRLWPLSPAYSGRPAAQGFILGFGSVPVEQMAENVERLCALLPF